MNNKATKRRYVCNYVNILMENKLKQNDNSFENIFDDVNSYDNAFEINMYYYNNFIEYITYKINSYKKTLNEFDAKEKKLCYIEKINVYL